jgi:nicotinate-nucleotide adenylyltransferase
MKIGLYFGSFNPVHNAHLIIANYIAENTRLDQVWLVVSPQNPLKPANGLLNEYDRLHLVRLSIEGEKKLRVSDIEFKLPRPSFTIDTLTYLNEKYPEHLFSIIMGSDSFTNIGKWKNHELLLANYKIYIYVRPGFPVAEQALADIEIVKAPMLEISSTEIRKMIAANKSIRFWVPDVVFEELGKSSFYRSKLKK